MLEFITVNWPTMLIFLCFVVYIICLVIKGEWDKLRELAYKLMLSAERLFTENQGEEKMEAVFAAVYKLVPELFYRFVPPDYMKKKLQEWYDLAKDYLDDGVINSEQFIPPG